MNPRSAAAAALLLLALPACLPAQTGAPFPPGGPVAPAGPAGGPGYADLVDLVLVSPVVIDATVRSASRIKPAEAPGLAPGRTRFYVEADVGALVRGTQAIPARVNYVVDLPPDATGRAPKLKKRRVLLFARPVQGAPGDIQLAAPDAQLDWTPDADRRIRAIAAAVVAPDAPPAITGVGNAFHVPGALPGEGETQVFLTTATGTPVSLSILRRPGEQPRWAVALSEIVDDAATPPAPETLLWYRLACALPRSLPERSTASLSEADATAARADYAVVIAALGPCGRTRVSGGGAPA